MQDKIQEIMRLVLYYNGATTWGTTEQQIAARAALESKLRELVREPLSDDDVDNFYENSEPLHGDYGGFHAGFRCAERAHGVTSASGEV